MISIQVQDEKLLAQLKRAQENAVDLKIPFKLIQESWFKTNRAIFSLSGPGKYMDLKESTKRYKTKKLGSPYPILRMSGRLEKTLIQYGDTANKIYSDYMLLGSSIPYAKFLQSGTKFMPARPPVFAGGEAAAPDDIKKRVNIWTKIVSDYITRSLK